MMTPRTMAKVTAICRGRGDLGGAFGPQPPLPRPQPCLPPTLRQLSRETRTHARVLSTTTARPCGGNFTGKRG